MNSTFHPHGRRRGIAAVYIGLLLVVIVSIAAYSVDMSWLYNKKSTAQQAADSAALAGAWQQANFRPQDADGQAKWYAGRPENGGYVDGTNGAAISIEYPAVDKSVTPNVTRPNWYRVKISRPEQTFFAGIFGAKFKSISVGATATALYETLAEFDIKGGGAYGKAPGDVNLSVFGSNGYYDFGDCYSTTKLSNGANNPLYTGKGYDFTIRFDNWTDKSKTAYIQIFDPDCYNIAGINADGVTAIDEFRTSGGGNSSNPQADSTTTRYSLYKDMGTSNPDDDVLLKTEDVGYYAARDMIWNDFFSLAPNTIAQGNLRLNVLSINGSSENGFDLRVNDKVVLSKTLQDADQDNFTTNNGSVITAQGHMPMNFNKSGSVDVQLGVIPVAAAGGQLTIRKFDTDVGAKSITYKCSTLPGMSWPGLLSAGGAFATDTITIPTNYTTAGIWTATYAAGVGDTSVWDMSYSNYGPGKPGSVKLIQ